MESHKLEVRYMKNERLYAITLHLLNHGKTSATELSKKFEVSVRTIQRDIDSLCQAGVPIVSETGVSGGYYLSDSFIMNAQTATEEDYSYILTALKGFSTAFDNPRIEATLDKILTLAGKNNNSIILDFSVLREVDENLMHTLQEAIKIKRAVSFKYTNTENVLRIHTVEPIAVVYQWYAWYLLAYSRVKDDYRLYKLVRISDLETTGSDFIKEHGDIDAILKEKYNNTQKITQIKARCRPEAKQKAIEYLNGIITTEHSNGECDMTLSVIESEHLWLGTILSLGDGILIKEPEHIRGRVIETAEKIMKSYKNYDI